MEECFGRPDTVFASHYPQNVSLEDEQGVHRFGPLVVAGGSATDLDSYTSELTL